MNRTPAMHTLDIPFHELEISRSDLLLSLSMGAPDYVPDADMERAIGEASARAAGICKPRAAYRLFEPEQIGERSVRLDGRELNTGKIITPHLAGADRLAVFVATAGREFDRWLHEIKSSGDIVMEFTADALGSEIAEAAVRALLQRIARQTGAKQTNPYSPGYCGWHVREQRVLFSLLPPSPCGVTLGDSCLMSPIKSVSGIFATGSRVRQSPYSCHICDMPTCFKKRR